MNISKQDRKIVIEDRDTTVTNNIGEKVPTPWTTFLTTYAKVQGAGGREQLEADKDTATVKRRFKIRFFAGIDETMRIVYDGKNYDIESIQELDREGLWITATYKK